MSREKDIAAKVASIWLDEMTVEAGYDDDMDAYFDEVYRSFGRWVLKGLGVRKTRRSGDEFLVKDQSLEDFEELASKLEGHRSVSRFRESNRAEYGEKQYDFEVTLDLEGGSGRFDSYEVREDVDMSMTYVPRKDLILFWAHLY